MTPTTLELAGSRAGDDAVVTAQGLPALEGNGSEDLLCGQCGQVVARNLTRAAVAAAFKTSRRLLLECTCGGLNVIQNGERPA